MKILKYLFLIILVLLLLFIVLGLIKPSIQYGHEVSVNKTIEEAWAVHQDETRLSEWIKGFISIDLLSGQAGEVNSTYKVTINPGEGQENFEMIETILSKKDLEQMTIHFDSEMMDFTQTTSFLQKDASTILKTTADAKGKGLLMRSMFAAMHLFGNTFQKQEAENLEALKRVIETNTKNYFLSTTPPNEN